MSANPEPPAFSTARRPADRKRQLIDRAAQLFLERGYPQVSVAEIARAAGVTGPSLYRHFDDKQALLTAACGTVPAAPAGPATSAAPSPTPSTTSTGTRSTLRVVGLGDSVTSGEHCDCDDYVTGFGHLLAEGHGAQREARDGQAGAAEAGGRKGHGRNPRKRWEEARRGRARGRGGARTRPS